MSNLNPVKNPITTLAGVVFLGISVFMYVLPMIMVVHKDFTEQWYIPLIPAGLGILLVLSPDSLVRGADKTIDKFTSEKTTVTEKTVEVSKPADNA